METFAEIWPIAAGQQGFIFNFAAAAVVGHILLNFFSIIRQGLPIKQLVLGLFTNIGVKNKIERVISSALLAILWCSFFVLIIDVLFNGIQL